MRIRRCWAPQWPRSGLNEQEAGASWARRWPSPWRRLQQSVCRPGACGRAALCSASRDRVPGAVALPERLCWCTVLTVPPALCPGSCLPGARRATLVSVGRAHADPPSARSLDTIVRDVKSISARHDLRGACACLGYVRHHPCLVPRVSRACVRACVRARASAGVGACSRVGQRV